MAEFRHIEHAYREDLVVHVPCGAICTLDFVPKHECNPLQVELIARLRRGEPRPDTTAAVWMTKEDEQ